MAEIQLSRFYVEPPSAEELASLAEIKETEQTVFEGKVMRVSVDTVRLANGETAYREVSRCRGGVCVIPIDEKGNVIVERQYRYAQDDVLLEIPAGKLEEGEDPLFAAARELEEETGYRAAQLTSLGMMIPTPALFNEKIWMYMATGLTGGKRHLDEDEILHCGKIPLAELKDAVMEGKIPDAKTQICVLRAYLALSEEPSRR